MRVSNEPVIFMIPFVLPLVSRHVIDEFRLAEDSPPGPTDPRPLSSTPALGEAFLVQARRQKTNKRVMPLRINKMIHGLGNFDLQAS